MRSTNSLIVHENPQRWSVSLAPYVILEGLCFNIYWNQFTIISFVGLRKTSALKRVLTVLLHDSYDFLTLINLLQSQINIAFSIYQQECSINLVPSLITWVNSFQKGFIDALKVTSLANLSKRLRWNPQIKCFIFKTYTKLFIA